MGKKYKVKKDYGSGQRSSYYGFRRDFPDGSRKGRFRKSASRTERGRKIGKIALMVLGFAAVVAIAFFITDFALTLSNKPATTKPSQTDSGAGVQAADTQQEPSKAPVVQQKAAAAVWLPEKMLRSNSSLDSFLSNAKQIGATAVVVDVKDTDGSILFPSDLDQVKTTGAAKNAYPDFSQALKKIRDSGLSVMVRVQCFRDPLAARKLGEGSAVCYQRPGTLWLDNSADKGGKPWLNPYSEAARKYLTDLIGELAAMDLDSILLDSVQFPSGYALGKTYYVGESESGLSRNDILKNFVADAKKAAGDKNVILMQSGEGSLGGGEEQYHGSLFGSGADVYAPDLRLSGLKGSVSIGEESFSPTKDPAGFLTAAGKQLKSAAGDAALMPLLDAGSNLSAQVEALKAAGIESYIVYSAGGSYTAVK
ncbi:MAG: hypothetical protein KIC46_07225 [Clostridiales bacterium]|nr:hypothetical protein [Clostridiales bacterium]